MVMEDLSHFCCVNSQCAEHGKRAAGNLVVCGRSGATNRLLRCHRCGARFSERKGTVFFRSHLPGEKVVSILEHVHEGVGMRKTGRLERVKEDTVIRYAKLAGAHAKSLHEELVVFSPGDTRGAVGREVVLRPEKRKALRRRQPC
jgi:LacI family transcriptional regulator